MDSTFFSEFPDVLATHAGRPPKYDVTDSSTAKVEIIPDRLLKADPREVLEALTWCEDLRRSGAAPSTATRPVARNTAPE